MVDPISGQAASQVIEKSLEQPQTSSGPRMVSGEESAEFSEAMHGIDPAQVDPSQVDPALLGGQQQGLIHELDTMSSSIREAQKSIVEGTKGMGDMGELLRMQFEVAQLTTTQTMVGQVGQKTSQGSQQLLKGQ